MSGWWTYRLSDFLLFSPRTYYRLFELYNAQVWPAHVATLALGLALLVALMRGGEPGRRAAYTLLGAAWLWIGWGFHIARYATINWAAVFFGVAFVLEGALLFTLAAVGGRAPRGAARNLRRRLGVGLLAFAIAGHPLLGMLFGRPWAQAEVFGLAPDPTALGTLGALLLSPVAAAPPLIRALLLLLWSVPLLWALVSGATLWAMQAPDAWLLPLSALLALLVLLPARRRA
ncbi:MAG TPA: DUF6064 family protein [Burkholderiaceae bacterium]|nr:DUF6064 family protein [Burkholderiaceae bacterium]